jgi:hypothetical protein
MSGKKLLKASERGDLYRVNRLLLLSDGADVNHKDNVCVLYNIKYAVYLSCCIL